MKVAMSILAAWCFFEGTALFAQTFVLRTKAAGLAVVEKTNGVAVADYDLDGDLDIYFVARQQYSATDTSTWNCFLRNNGDDTFSDVTLKAGVISRVSGQPFSEVGYKLGAAWGDYDNDGYPDIFLTNYGGNELYRNQGDGTFVNVTASAGVGGNASHIHSSAVWWDYDLDGDLDLYVSAWLGSNVMYENNGDGTFINVTQASGLASSRRTWTSMPIDGNNDGLPDLYVVEDLRAPSKFFVNLGNKTFREAAQEFGLANYGNGMGVAVGDYNNDGFFDIYVTNISGLELFANETNPLFTNTGKGVFVNKAVEMGVSIAGWGWGTAFFDCDHDGDLDLYVVNGFDFNGASNTPNIFFENMMDSGKLPFKNATAQSGAEGLADGLGLAVFDYDNDGDMDLLVSNSKEAPYFYENHTPTQNWLKIQLEGVESNRSAFGAIVKVTAAGKSYYRQNDGVGFLCQNLQPLHFGIDKAQIAEKVVVRWPRGNEETIENVKVNQTIKIREGDGMVTGVKSFRNSPAPENFQLLGNYPNPFNGGTAIKFHIPQPGEVTLIVTNVLGQPVRTIKQNYHDAGAKAIRWDGTDEAGAPVGSGIYLYRIYLQNLVRVGKMICLK